MKRQTLSLVAVCAGLWCAASVSGQQAPAPANLDELLERVRTIRQADDLAIKKRQEEFLANRNRQKELLEEARARLKASEARGAELQTQFEGNERRLAELETTLATRLGTMGEMFGAVRQAAGDAKGVFGGSLISSQIKGRAAFMSRLAESKRLPETADLEKLWYELQREMTETGKIVTYMAPVVLPSGAKEDRTVVRVGVFNAVSDGKFLNTTPENAENLYELSRQPSARFRGMAKDLQEAQAGMVSMALDPSRGAILGLIVQAPSLEERIRQGGFVGYVILFFLTPLGLIIAAERFGYLLLMEARVNKQLKSEVPNKNNPLGRIMSVYLDNQKDDVETLSLKLDEAVLRDVPKLERGLATIKILAAVAPLLGLLGTVTGMIKTFQAITLFGAGDPKLMAGGISEALVTTVLGLMAAIPLVLLHSILTGRSNRLVQILDEQSTGYVAEIAERTQAQKHG